MVENLRLLFQDVSTVHINRFGSLRDWISKASNKDYWNQLVKCLLHPDTPLPEQPKKWRPLPPWRARQAANRQTDNALQITTQTMTKIMRKAAVQTAITATEIERAIRMKDHTGKDNANNPLAVESPPRTRTTTIAVQSAPPCSIQSKAVAQR